MIQLTRLHWHTGQIEYEPLYVNPEHIIWFEWHTRKFGGLGHPEFEQACTALNLTSYNLSVLETPEQIIELIK